MKRFILIVATAFLFVGAPRVNATPTNPDNIAAYTGNDLLANCPAESFSSPDTDAGVVRNVACVIWVAGFAQGFQAGLWTFGGTKAPTFTIGRTFGQLYDIVHKYVVDHPTSRDQLLMVLIPRAMLVAVQQTSQHP